MKIGIDASLAVGDKAGAGFYAATLIKALAQIDKENNYLLYPFFGNMFHPDFKTIKPPSHNFNVYMSSAPRPLIRWKRLRFGIDNKRFFNNIDLLHSTSFFIPKSYKGRLVSTIYDVSFLIFPECHTEENRLYCLQGTLDAVSHCQKIIAISENTKVDLVKYFNIQPDRVAVTQLAPRDIFKPLSDENFIRRILAKYKIDGKYIFTVGSIEPRKNLARLIQAYAQLDEEIRNAYYLVIAGGSGWLNTKIYDQVAALNLTERVKFLGYVVDEDLPVLYNAASVFVYPSLYEGFGLPVVEAMACRTPVITSNNSSLKEIAENVALLVDPLDVKEIANTIQKVLNDNKLAGKLATKGISRASEFSWEETAKKTLAIYKSFSDKA